jgi:pentatricopeptide repeat protein
MVSAGVEPSMITWSALLNAYADSKQPYHAVQVLVHMRKQGLTPSVHVSSALAWHLDVWC